MCGRFVITQTPEELAELFEATPAEGLPQGADYNVCPTARVAAVISSGGARRLGPMRWGFIPSWYRHPTDGPLLFNARGESLTGKPAFRDAARARRCLIPAAGFYEWTKAGTERLPWFIARPDDAPMVFAGVWQMGRGASGERVASCAIVTTAARGRMAELHERVPVILEPGDWPLWLGEAGRGAARLMQPLPEGALAFRRVGPAVNSNRAAGAELIALLVE